MSRLTPSRLALAQLTLAMALACGGGDEAVQPAPRPETTAPPAGDVATARSARDPAPSAQPTTEAPRVVVLGDSLSAGLGLAEGQAWPAVLARELAAAGSPVELVNAGVSGDTSAGGRRRLEWLLRQEPDLLIVELGANDALRGQPVAAIEANLRAIVEEARAHGVDVLLVGLRIPPSYGADYAERFAAVYPRLAAELDVALVPFLLEGVAGHPELNLPDGVHPTAEGHRRLAATMKPWVEAELLR